MNSVDLGNYGESIAEEFLRAKDYAVLERKYRAGGGEIDLIAESGGTIAFVEVKYRKGLGFGYPREAVSPAKQRRIKNCALCYVAERGMTGRDFRFDVVEILDLSHGKDKMTIEHIENAFM
ncbi:MAG: YraN family protein [Clostridiales bacterium]|jgi:putative endonuclease|nr:YraN family protein [Clostridiales bacterium]